MVTANPHKNACMRNFALLCFGGQAMIKSHRLAAALVTSFIAAVAARPGQAQNAAPAPETHANKIVDKDFGRLSLDGLSAFNDIHLARLAIFEGKTDDAAKFITDAQTALGKAKAAGIVLTKAESELHPPAKTAAAAKTAPEKSATPVVWIPIDDDIVFGETFQPTNTKTAALGTAKKALAKGDGPNALKAIRLAEVDVDYTVALAPLESSITDIDQANKLVTSHDYYGASQSLKMAEDGVRFDEFDDVANVKNKASPAVAAKGK
jgi:hypothetical protein